MNLSESLAQRGLLRRLTAEYYWHNPALGDLFRPCRREMEHVYNRLQELQTKDVFRTTEILSLDVVTLERNKSGAVVFRYANDMATIQRRWIRPSLESDLRASSLSPPSLAHHRSDSGYSSPSLGGAAERTSSTR
jgi:hypothetical protein